METDKRVETLEDELKLIKGEVKETLASVRDYLLTSELPASEYQTIMAALGVGGGQKMEMKGNISMPKGGGIPEPPQAQRDELPQEEELAERDELPQEEEVMERDELPQEEEVMERDETFVPGQGVTPEDELVEQDEPFVSESELPEQQMEYGKINEEVSQSIPQVNLLANLIRWVSSAKKEIGSEQLPTLLEVYGISGHLAPELKEVIMHLADIASEQSTDANAAEIWSRLISELHGILTGGDAPLHPVRPFWSDDGGEIQPSEIEAEENKPIDKPLKLRLVFSNGESTDKEFCINLNPEDYEASKESP